MTANLADQLAAELRRRGHTITPDGRVTLAAAALVLGKAEGTLRNWRSAGQGPLTYKIAGTVTYRLADLVKFIEA